MARIHPGATLTPHFRDFLPAWVARQPWYAGTGIPSLTPVGFLRMEDPEGAVGIETHLLRDGRAGRGPVVYQLPLTYRGAPLDGGADALIATAEHSVLGTRWIYDGTADPAWRAQLLELVTTGGSIEPGARPGVGPVQARGEFLASHGQAEVVIELARVLAPGDAAQGALGLVTGTWYPHGPGAPPASGCLALVRKAGRGAPTRQEHS